MKKEKFKRNFKKDSSTCKETCGKYFLYLSADIAFTCNIGVISQFLIGEADIFSLKSHFSDHAICQTLSEKRLILV